MAKAFFSSVIFFVALIATGFSCTTNIWFPASADVSPGPIANNPRIAFWDSHGYVVAAFINTIGVDKIIQGAYSLDGGFTWAPSSGNLSNPAYESSLHQIVVRQSDGRVVCLWRGEDGSGNRAIQVAYSTDNGLHWSAAATDPISPVGSDSSIPRIDINPITGDFYAIWFYDAGATEQLQFSRSTDGNTWSAPITVATSTYIRAMEMAVNKTTGDIILCWREGTVSGGRIYSSVSTDQGATWSAPSQITPNVGCNEPLIAINDITGRVVCIWEYNDGSGDRVVQSSYSTDNGLTWQSTITLSKAGDDSRRPTFVLNSNTSYVTCLWRNTDATGISAIECAYSMDGGQSWKNVGRISPKGLETDAPFLVLNSSTNTIIASFEVFKDGDWYIQSIQSFDGGKTWYKAANDLTLPGQLPTDPEIDIIMQNATKEDAVIAFDVIEGSAQRIRAVSVREMFISDPKDRIRFLFQTYGAANFRWEAIPDAALYKIYSDINKTKLLYAGPEPYSTFGGLAPSYATTYYFSWVDAKGNESPVIALPWPNDACIPIVPY